MISKDRLVWYIGIGVAVLLAVGLYLGLSGDSPGAAGATATLEVFTGSVEVAPSGAEFAPAATGQALAVGDTVRTGADGRAAINWFDGSVTRLDHGTAFTVVTLAVDPATPGARVITGEQTTGSTYNRVVAITDSLSRFEIVTPTVTASVQGTVYIVTVAPDGATTVTVTEGGVAVQDAGATVEVAAGFMVTVVPGGAAAQVVPIAAGLLETDWVVFNRCSIDTGPDCEGGGSAATSTTTTLAGSTTTSTTVAVSPAASLSLVGSADALGPGCARTYRARLLNASGGVIDDDTTVVTFTVVSGGGSLVLSGGATARAVNGVASKTVVGDALGVVSLQASVGGLTSEVISFTVVPPRC